MKKKLQRNGLLACTVVIVILIVAVTYFHGLKFGYDGTHIYNTYFFSIENIKENYLKILNNIIRFVLPFTIPWYLFFLRKSTGVSSLFLYALMVSGLILCFWIPFTILSGLQSSTGNYNGSIHIGLLHFCMETKYLYWANLIAFHILLPWLVLSSTLGMKGRMWIYLFCAILIITTISIPETYEELYSQKIEYQSDMDALISAVLISSIIFIPYYVTVLMLYAVYCRLCRIPKVKRLHDRINQQSVRVPRQILADITGIGKAKYNDNISHGRSHLFLHILLPIVNIPVQKLVMIVSKTIHSYNYYFSIGAEYRILDTLVVYLIMLLLAGIYLKCTGCNTKTLIHYAVWGIVPCIMTALIMDHFELIDYKANYCSSFEDDYMVP